MRVVLNPIEISHSFFRESLHKVAQKEIVLIIFISSILTAEEMKYSSLELK